MEMSGSWHVSCISTDVNKFVLTILFSLFAGCGGQFSLPSQGQSSAAQTGNPYLPAPKILTVRNDFSNQVWAELDFSVVGGGEIEFSVKPHSGIAEILIHVTRYNFASKDISLSVTPSNDPSLYAELADLLDGTSSMQSIPLQGFTGTYKQVTLRHPSISIIPLYTNPLINGSSSVFDELYSYVIARI